MPRGAKPRTPKVKARHPDARKSLKNEGSRVGDLEKQLAEALKREAEALDQQTATAEILSVISRSPTKVRPVFETILERATTLCEAQLAHLWLYEGGEQFRLGAGYGSRPDHLQWLQQGLHRFSRPFFRDSGPWRVGQFADVRDTEPYRRGEPLWTRTADHEGMRTLLGVPLVKDGRLVGSIAVYRRDVRPFTDAQVELVKTFADQAVIAIENVRLFTELQEKNLALTTAHAQVSEALDQQTATSEILKAISRSPTDVQPVFDTIVESAMRLCEAVQSNVQLFDGNLMHYCAQQGIGPEAMESIRRTYPMRPDRSQAASRAVLTRGVVHLPDVLEDPDYRHEQALKAGARSVLSVPMMRERGPIGAITVARLKPVAFSETQMALLQTFADQAVIAIENVRLFKELEARNSDLRAALEQQTSTSEILRVISSSPTDEQPVFDAIVQSARRLCEATFSVVFLLETGQLTLAAVDGVDAAGITALHGAYPRPVARDTTSGRSILDRRVVHLEDSWLDPEYTHPLRDTIALRSILTVPIFREGLPIGALSVWRGEVRPFTDKQIALLQTFADQAVIALENVRLFKELEVRNRDLTAALEQQTATSEILRAITHAPTDTQPVFDTIVRSAVTLCHAAVTAVFLTDGQMVFVPANYGSSPEALGAVRARFPRPLDMESSGGIAILTRSVVHVPDTEEPSVGELVRQNGRRLGFRSLITVPMLREGAAVGAIGVYRREPGRFSDVEVALLQTFADQAVIAIENVRLFKELQARTGELTQSVEKLTALGEVSRAVSSTLDVETVLDTIVSRASQLAGAAGCSIFEYDEAAEQFELRATHNYDVEFVEALRATPLRKGEGLMGRAAEMREPVQVADITQPGAYQSSARDTLIRFGYRAVLSVPLLREDQIIGSLSFTRKAPGEFPPEVVDVLKTFATQSALAIQNARLFREIADKSAQLEAASRHKSEFLANMSHELRTPLNAIIGFSEVLVDRMFGELNEKQDEYLKDIYASGQHLLSLINDILDLSKIEAGRMELEATDFDLPSAIDNALTLVRERATRRGITLGHSVDERLGQIRGDERKVKQVLLNLLSNALKFTPEGGRIDVSARLQDGVAEVSVADTGVGIAPEDQEAVFEEFRQVGTADKKVEGTGLGLALSRKFIELHGGRIWLKSQVGHGSTFTFTLPVRRED
jgi:GAF domain-containing protein